MGAICPFCGYMKLLTATYKTEKVSYKLNSSLLRNRFPSLNFGRVACKTLANVKLSF